MRMELKFGKTFFFYEMKYSAEQQRFLTKFRFPMNAFEKLLKV